MKNEYLKDECPECLKQVSKEELEVFGGVCEECNLEMQDFD